MSSPSIKMQNSNLDYLQIGEGAGNFSENTQKQLISCPDLSRLPKSLLHRNFLTGPKVVFGREFLQKNVAECLFRHILQDTIFL